MRGKRRRWGRSYALWLFLQCAVAAAPLTVLVDLYPPFVVEKSSFASGPYVDAFKAMMHAQGIDPVVDLIPIRRALVMAHSTPNTCVLALNYSAATAEVLLYLGRIAPIYVWAYARHGEHVQAKTMSDLKHYQVGAADMAEVRQMLDEAGIPYSTLQFNSAGLQMLEAHRFDVLLSDIGPELDATRAGTTIDRLFVVARLERWLACNPATDPVTLGILRGALHDGLFTDATKDIWARYGMADYYAQVRQEWLAVDK